MFKNLDCKDLYFVMYDSPISFLDDIRHRDFFGKIIKLKRDGFRTLKEKYLAFDTTDYIGTHLLICKKVEDDFFPLICGKAITEARCQNYSLPFSGLEGVKYSKSQEHIRALTEFINCKKKNGDVAYTSSVTIEPLVSDDKSRKLLLDLFLPLIAQYHNEFDVPTSFCIGRTKTNASVIIKKIGYRKIELNNKELPTLNMPLYLNDEFDLLVFDKPSQESLSLLAKFQETWDRRIIVTPENENNLFDTDNDLYHDERKIA